MIARKEQYFDHFRRPILAFEVFDTGDGWHSTWPRPWCRIKVRVMISNERPCRPRRARAEKFSRALFSISCQASVAH